MRRESKAVGCRIRVADWPDADRAAWLAAQRPRDPLDPGVGIAGRWKSSTRRLIEEGYGHWLGWLHRTGKLDLDSDPADRASRERVGLYLEMLRNSGLAPYTVAGRLHHLGDALRTIAPDRDWIWLLRGSSRLHNSATPTRDRAACLRPAQDVRALGFDLMHAADHDRFRTNLDRATLFRDGLLIAFLVVRPFRSRNLHDIEIGRQLQRGDTGWLLSIDPSETKTGVALNCSWPADLTDKLDRYISVHRPVLLACRLKPMVTLEALWISRHGTAMTTHAIAYEIKSRTETEFGQPINAHSFRHLAATTIAIANPGGAADIKMVLGHEASRTGEKHYNHAGMVDANRGYQRTLDVLRRQTRSSDHDG
jgi:integrase/recombinase XerD